MSSRGKPGAEKIRICIQCGTCSGGCPFAHLMDYTPRRLFAMIRAGMRDEVLRSNTLWLCSSCYTCAVRCPQDIPFTDIMYAIKNIAVAEGKYPDPCRGGIFYGLMADQVSRYGMTTEGLVMTRYYLKLRDIKGLMNNMGLALGMIRRGLLPLVPILPRKIKAVGDLHKIVKYVDSHRSKIGGGS